MWQKGKHIHPFAVPDYMDLMKTTEDTSHRKSERNSIIVVTLPECGKVLYRRFIVIVRSF